MPEEYISRCPYPDLTFPKGNIITQIFKNIGKWENKPSFVCGDTLQGLSYKELQHQVRLWCRYFSSTLAKGFVVTIITPVSVEACVAMLGIWAAGMVYIGINPENDPDKLARQLRDNSVRLMIVHTEAEQNLRNVASSVLSNIEKICIGPSTASSEGRIFAKDILTDPKLTPMKEIEVTESEAAMRVCTSGTTSKPKYVGISHHALIANMLMLTSDNFYLPKPTTANYQDVAFLHHALLTTWISSIVPPFLYKGQKIIVKPLDINKVLDDIHKHKITHFHTAPALLKLVLTIPTARPGILEHLDAVYCASSHMPEALAKAFKEHMSGVTLQAVFGMTEILDSHSNPVGGGRIGYTGQPLPNVLTKVVDVETRQPLPPNTQGEILIKTPSVMMEYMNNPTATSQTKTSDGWIITGDFGEVDEDGYLKIVDRIKEMIKVGLSPVPVIPSEIENVILQHPGVSEACVVGVPHPDLLEAPRAYVVLTDSSVSGKDLQQFVAERMTYFNRLVGGVVVVDNLPKSPAGKTARAEVKKMARMEN